MAAKVATASAARTALLDELKAAAEKMGLRVREERLLREVGYRVRSGCCRLGADQILFLDRALPPAAQIDVLVDELAGRSLDDIYLSPAARALVERAVKEPRDGRPEAHGG
jgi:hypothetical protein